MKAVLVSGFFVGFAGFAFALVPSPCTAWIFDGVPVCLAPSNQDTPELAPDGAGGAFYTWRDARGGEFNIYCQRVDAHGNPLWTTDGIVVCDMADAQTLPRIMADGVGGAFIVWYHYQDNERDLYAQRVSGDGDVLWPGDGVVICNAEGHQGSHALVPDGAGGMIVAWEDARHDTNDIYAQRVDSSGNTLWPDNGVAIVAVETSQHSPRMITDGEGGAVVVWLDGREITTDVYAQRFNGNGTTLWLDGGVAICTAAEHQRNARIASDGQGGAIIAWYDAREPGMVFAYAQRVDAGGIVRWTIDGVTIAPLNTDQTYAEIASDDAGGAIIAWNQGFPGEDTIYAQRVDASGTPLWGVSGVEVGGETGNTDHPRIIADGQGGAVIAWEDYRATSWSDIYAQRLDGDGNALWANDGVAVCTALWDQAAIQMTRGAGGSVILTWEDARQDAQLDIYTSRVTAGGIVIPTSVRVPELSTGNLSSFPNPFNPRTNVRFELDRPQRVSLSVHDLAGRRLAQLADAVLPSGLHRLVWDGRDAGGREIGSGVYILRLETEEHIESHRVTLTR